MTKVLLDGISKTYGKDFTALKSLSLTINSGEFVSILGPSGCGKTTTLKLIAGLLDATAGHIYFDDEDVTYLPPQRRGVGLVFQDYAVFPHMTVYENIAYGLKVRKVDSQIISQRVKEVAELLGLEELLNKKPKEMNVGELQRTSLARALAIDPRVLLLDEPLSNLDAAFKIRARLEIKRLQKVLRKTVIYVTHDQFEAMSLSDRIAVLNHGTLQQYDAPNVLFEKPRNKFVAGFIGTPPMNILEGTIMQHNNEYKVDLGDLKFAIPAYGRSQLVNPPQDVYVGIRPQHVNVHKSSSAGEFRGKVYVIENIGSEQILTLRIGSLLLRGISEAGQSFKVDDEVSFNLATDHIHIFDRKSEERLIAKP